MGTQPTRKQVEAAQKFARVVAEKEIAQTFSLCVKQVHGSFQNAIATVSKLMHLSFMSKCSFTGCLYGGSRKIP